MKRFAVFCLACAGCGAHARHDLGVRQVVTVSRDSGQVQFYGTHLFMTRPEGFFFDTVSDTWDKNSITYMSAAEYRHPYNDVTHEMTEIYRQLRKDGFTVYYNHTFSFQDDSAEITYAGGQTDREQNVGRIWMTFGTRTTTVTLFGQFKNAYDDDRSAILRAMLSCYLDTAAAAPTTAIQKFDVDLLQSGFGFNTQDESTYYYTVDGQGDPKFGLKDEIIIWQEPSLGNDAAMQKRFQSIIETFGGDRVNRETQNEKRVRIGGLDASEATITGTQAGKACTFYFVMVQNKNETVGFQGSAFDNQELRLQQYQQIARTLRLK